MKIVNTMLSKYNGGLHQMFLHYTKLLNAQGNEVTSIISSKAEIKESCSPNNLLIVNSKPRVFEFFAMRELKKKVIERNPDCIITHDARARRLHKKSRLPIPRVGVCHGKVINWETDAIIAITEQMRREFIQLGRSPKNVYVVPNMIDIPEGISYPPLKDTDEPVIGVCARLSYEKGIDVFIEAIAELKRRKRKFKVKIAGDGREKKACIALIHKYGLENDISLLGWVNDTASFYKSLDIFCIPSREEAFGLVILESMLYGLPLVIADLPGPAEVIGDSKSALMVTPACAGSMADALEKIIIHKNLAQDLSQRAFQRVHDFSFQKIGPILQEALEKIRLDFYRVS